MTPAPFLAANQVLVTLGPLEWGAVALASAIIFAILGRKLLRDIERWRSG